MPGFDGTGPRGIGPMTGRGLGYCVMPVGDSSAYGASYMPYARVGGTPGRALGILPYGAIWGKGGPCYSGCGRRWRTGGRIFGRFGRRRWG
jgi:hypothetical protein